MKNSIILYILALCISIFLSNCDKKDPEIPNEEELITTMKYTLTPLTGGNTVIFSFKDLDGDGGSVPVITTGSLTPNTSYAGSIELLNELSQPVTDVSEEVYEEGTEHQFFFRATGGLAVSIQYDDTDTDGKPLGLKTKLTTAAVSTGSLTITLRHEPDKAAQGVANGDITNAGGETDIEVTFNVQIK
jgi:hypothetical protein